MDGVEGRHDVDSPRHGLNIEVLEEGQKRGDGHLLARRVHLRGRMFEPMSTIAKIDGAIISSVTTLKLEYWDRLQLAS